VGPALRTDCSMLRQGSFAGILLALIHQAAQPEASLRTEPVDMSSSQQRCTTR
jgi:hypothetical protein